MSPQPLHLREVKSLDDLLVFIRFPWKIYRGNTYWVPPLIQDQRSKLSPNYPFFTHAEMTLLLAMEGEEVLGRIAGIIDHQYVVFHEEKTGFFGFFESVEDQRVADILLSEVCKWHSEHGMEKVIGPMNPSTNDECGLLIDGFASSPCLMMPYNPPYYASLLHAFGLTKAMDLYAYWLDQASFVGGRLSQIAQKVMRREPQLSVRPLNMRRLDEELKIIKEIYNNAWSKNWGFVPMTEEEVDTLAKSLKPLVVPELVLIACWEDEPVAFSVSLPDYNQVLRHLNGKLGIFGTLKFLYLSRKIRTLRVMLLGVKREFQKRGVEGLLYMETFNRGMAKGYHQAECSWILENNPLMQRGLEAMGGRRYKTYRIYEMSL